MSTGKSSMGTRRATISTNSNSDNDHEAIEEMCIAMKELYHHNKTLEDKVHVIPQHKRRQKLWILNLSNKIWRAFVPKKFKPI